jgi:hypothetical protein
MRQLIAGIAHFQAGWSPRFSVPWASNVGNAGVVSTYIHLNRARAKLIRVGKERLSRYGWSSYPWYVKRRQDRPAWLVTQRVLGDLGLGPNLGAVPHDVDILDEGSLTLVGWVDPSRANS